MNTGGLSSQGSATRFETGTSYSKRASFTTKGTESAAEQTGDEEFKRPNTEFIKESSDPDLVLLNRQAKKK